jgi:hypothetical protein
MRRLPFVSGVSGQNGKVASLCSLKIAEMYIEPIWMLFAGSGL